MVFAELKHIIKPLIPLFFLHQLRFIKHFFNADERKLFKLRFSFNQIPPDGYLPCHIRDYCNNQKKLVESLVQYSSLVVFFNIVRKVIYGGMMSIDRFVYHSFDITENFDFKVVQSGIPVSYACVQNPFYDWCAPLVDFKFIVKYLQPVKLLLNIPESFCREFLDNLTDDIFQWLSRIPDLRINILNQNDTLMPAQCYIERLRKLVNGKISITTAHEKYCTQEKAEKYACPIYQLTPFLPEFNRVAFSEKEDVIVVSPDYQPLREEIIMLIKNELPDYRIVIIRDMHFEDYKRNIAKAKFIISFGEGWDGYFLESYLSGSIGITVKNPVFFPPTFKDVPTVFDTWFALYTGIVNNIKQWSSNEYLYNQIQKEVETEISKFVNNERSKQELFAFYERLGRRAND